MPEDDQLEPAFAAFRAEYAPLIRPAGLAPVRVIARRRRRRTRLAVGLGLAIALLAVIAVPSAGRGNRQSAAGGGPDLTDRGIIASDFALCRPSDIAAQVTRSARSGPQTWVVISITNASGRVCRLIGYPTVVSANGYSDGERPSGGHNIDITVQDRGFPGYDDPGGAARFVLNPNSVASFALGTSPPDPYQMVVTSVTITLHGVPGPISVPMPAGMTAGADATHAVELIVTGWSIGPDAMPAPPFPLTS
jgi:hypothetical protein